jgi:hypothetical protein
MGEDLVDHLFGQVAEDVVIEHGVHIWVTVTELHELLLGSGARSGQDEDWRGACNLKRGVEEGLEATE